MKRISRFALMTLFSLLVMGSTRVFAGNGGNKQGQNKSNQGNNSGGLFGWIEQVIDDIFGDNNNQGNNNNQGSGNNLAGNPTSGAGTAPIDGGITLLLGAGIGLGLSKAAKARRK